MCYHAHAVLKESARVVHLTLRDFRNYERLELDIPGGLTVLRGSNGQGKTNILEAIYYLAVLRSFRTSRVNDLLRTGTRRFHCRARLSGILSGTDVEISAEFANGARRLAIDGSTTSSRQFVNQFNCVAMVPEDIELAKGAPTGRRRYLNILLSQLFPDYLESLIRFDKILKNRNAMLKNANRYGREAIGAYDPMMVQHGARLVARRVEMIERLNRRLPSILSRIDGGKATMELRYQCGLGNHSPDDWDEKTLIAAFSGMVEQAIERDVEMKQTRYGPHRDDVAILFDDVPVSQFGSEGQCRLASLVMKLVAADLLKQEMGEFKPLVLLIDDVFGELDQVRRKGFFETIAQNDQVVMTCTETPREIMGLNPRIHTVTKGSIQIGT